MKRQVMRGLHHVLIIWIGIGPVACSFQNTEAFLEEANDAPWVSFTFLENSVDRLRDSIKFSAAIPGNQYEKSLTVRDVNDNVTEVFFTLLSGQGLVRSNGLITSDELTISRDGVYDFSYEPTGLGFHEIEIIAIDEIMETDTIVLELVAYENLAPVANLKWVPVRILGDYEYTLDASESFDRDATYGGELVAYEFSINNLVFETDEDQITFIFGSEGIFILGLRVKDNDGVWSTKFTQNVLID